MRRSGKQQGIRSERGHFRKAKRALRRLKFLQRKETGHRAMKRSRERRRTSQLEGLAGALAEAGRTAMVAARGMKAVRDAIDGPDGQRIVIVADECSYVPPEVLTAALSEFKPKPVVVVKGH